MGVADSLWSLRLGVKPMMGERRVAQEHLFYEFSLERHVPETHLLRSIDRFVELGGLRRELAPFYSEMGRPSIDPELLIRMLIVAYCFGIRSERRLCEEVHLNLAYRWFCRLGLDGDVPDHSTFSKNRLGRFRDSAASTKPKSSDATVCDRSKWRCRAVRKIWPSVLSSSVSICSESVLAQRLTRESQPMSGFDAPAICKADSTSAAASPSAATTGLSPSLLFRNAASSPSHERDLRFCSSRPNSRTN